MSDSKFTYLERIMLGEVSEALVRAKEAAKFNGLTRHYEDLNNRFMLFRKKYTKQ